MTILHFDKKKYILEHDTNSNCVLYAMGWEPWLKIVCVLVSVGEQNHWWCWKERMKISSDQWLFLNQKHTDKTFTIMGSKLSILQ